MSAVVGTLAWEFQVSLPLMASKVFGGGTAAYGMMASVMGAGAAVGGLITAGRVRPRARNMCVAAIGWGLAILAAAVAPNLAWELVAMVFVGYGSISFNSLAKTTLQLAAEPSMRGRVMALWALAWLGSTPVGGPIVGWTAQVAGARWSLVLGAVACLACGLAALPVLRRVDRAAAQEEAPQEEARHEAARHEAARQEDAWRGAAQAAQQPSGEHDLTNGARQAGNSPRIGAWSQRFSTPNNGVRSTASPSPTSPTTAPWTPEPSVSPSTGPKSATPSARTR
jgi:MFS family permease